MKRLVAISAILTFLLLQTSGVQAQRLDRSCRPGGGQSFPLTTLERLNDGVWAVPCVFLATSAAEWEELQREMEERGELVIEPPIPAPAIDWKRNNVIVVSLGTLPSSGYGVEVQAVKKMSGTALLEIQIILPGDPLRPQVMTFPYHMIEVEKYGMNKVEICSQSFRFDGGNNPREQADLELNDFTNLTAPGAKPDTWGGIKARFR